MSCPRQAEFRNEPMEIRRADLAAAGRGGRLSGQTLVLTETASTNSFLLQNAAQLPDGTLLAAEHQTAGRGRLGRTWQSVRGASILLSALLHEPADSELLKHASTLASLAACEAIRATTACDCRVRWPNDLVIHARKIGGVLVESSRTVDAGDRPTRSVVIGIGINCNQRPEDFSAELRDKATSLRIESARPVDRIQVLKYLIERLSNHLAACASPHYRASSLSAWRALTDDIGSRAELVQNGRRFSGTILDVDDNGDLVVQLDIGGRSHFAAATTTRQW